MALIHSGDKVFPSGKIFCPSLWAWGLQCCILFLKTLHPFQARAFIKYWISVSELSILLEKRVRSSTYWMHIVLLGKSKVFKIAFNVWGKRVWGFHNPVTKNSPSTLLIFQGEDKSWKSWSRNILKKLEKWNQQVY